MNRILESSETQPLFQNYSRDFIQRVATQMLDSWRREVRAGQVNEDSLNERVENLHRELSLRLKERLSPALCPVINAAGIIIFTNLGRSPLAPEVLEKVANIGTLYNNLEYDLEEGRRGNRDLHFESRIVNLMSCEAATVCNNAAAALMLILNTLADSRVVLVSRGELIEIGGSFRLPEIMSKSGARLKEVGTTNKTRASDYRAAIDEHTALILRVHPSNYRITGFSERPTIAELAGIAHDASLPLAHDVGSGLLFESDLPNLQREPSVSGSLAAGSDLVCFSGDKLLGGPQAGLILGKKSLVSRLRKNPLMRAIRAGKLTYSALEWTLMEYEKGSYRNTLPLWRLASTDPEEIRQRSEILRQSLEQTSLEIGIERGWSLTGGGSAPEERINTWLLSVRDAHLSVNEMERRLRRNRPPIICRIEKDRLVFDLRTVFPGQDAQLGEALRELAGH